MSRIVGRFTLRIDGQAYATKTGATLNLGGVQRNVEKTGYEVNYSEEPMEATFQGAIQLKAGMSLEPLRNLADAVVQVEADTGQTWVIRGAFLTEPLSFSDGSGSEVALNLAGSPAEEVLA